ncbi:MAG: hypothetical protein DCC50_12135 [Acidobacteria bacterium]|nr:MAG: hypothetical protein DCC50_12135 [Acidobacteriota bacterium]
MVKVSTRAMPVTRILRRQRTLLRTKKGRRQPATGRASSSNIIVDTESALPAPQMQSVTALTPRSTTTGTRSTALMVPRTTAGARATMSTTTTAGTMTTVEGLGTMDRPAIGGTTATRATAATTATAATAASRTTAQGVGTVNTPAMGSTTGTAGM